MKKNTVIICAALISAVVCGCGNRQQFTLTGTVDGAKNDGMKVYLHDLYAEDANIPLDSTVMADGKFVFKGTAKEAKNVVVKAEDQSFMVRLILEPGNIVLNNDSIGGTPLNDKLQAYTAKHDVSDIEEAMAAYLPLYYGAPDAKARAEAEHILDSLDALGSARLLEVDWNLYNENKDNILGVMAMEEIVSLGTFSYGQLDSIIAAAAPAVGANKTVQTKLKQLRAVEETSVGKHYTDLEGVDGKLSDLVEGKLALVDFWASWCGPCRAEIKDNLVPLWAKYKDLGLVIVGLNVWERGDAAARRAAHEKAMAELGITYPQLVDSTRTATDTYGVNGIPQILLIGPDGTILARDLRGAAIEEAIKEAMAQ